jgi:hypothetical protein
LRNLCALSVTAALLFTAARAADAPANFAGMWRNEMLPGSSIGAMFEFSANIPFKPATQKIVDNRKALRATGNAVATAHLMCRPTGVQGMSSPRGPALIVQTPDELIFISQEDREVRHVYLNQGHPGDLKPSYNGNSVGHWEGATLLIDTVGFNDRGVLEEKTDSPLSPQAHLVERLSIEGDRLTDVMTIEDPVYYTRAFSATRIWRRSPDAHLLDYDCAENPRSDDVENLTFDKDWFRPVCLRHIRDGAADEKVTCKHPGKKQGQPQRNAE